MVNDADFNNDEIANAMSAAVERYGKLLSAVIPAWQSGFPAVFQYLARRRDRRTVGDDRFGVVFAITQHCNLGCWHCAVNAPYRSTLLGESDAELSTVDVARIIEKIGQYEEKKKVPVFFMFGGGEPSLRVDFPEVVRLASDTFGKEDTGFCTNGSFRDADEILAVSECVGLLEVSLDGFETYHNAWRTPGRLGSLGNAYGKTLALVKRAAAEAGDILEVTSVLTRENASLLPNFARFLRDQVGVRNYSVHRPIPVGRMAHRSDVIPAVAEYYDFFAAMADVALETDMFRVHLHHSLESIYSALLLGRDIHASDLPMGSSRHSIGICWRGGVHFDPWALVPPLACLSPGSLLDADGGLEDFWDTPNSILSLIAEAKKANVRCRGCVARCTGGMRLAAMMEVLVANGVEEAVSPGQLMAAISASDPACPLAAAGAAPMFV